MSWKNIIIEILVITMDMLKIFIKKTAVQKRLYLKAVAFLTKIIEIKTRRYKLIIIC